MRTIYKYSLTLGGTQILVGPTAKVLDVQMQDGLKAWIEVDPEEAKFLDLSFDVRSTGEYFDAGKTYLKTVQDGNYVWHIYMD